MVHHPASPFNLKPLLALLFLAALSVLAFVFVGSDQALESAHGPATLSEEGPSATDSTDLQGLAPEPLQAEKASEALQAKPIVAQRDAIKAKVKRGRVIEGVVIAVDAMGRKHREENGFIQLSDPDSPGISASFLHVDVVDGRFEFTAPKSIKAPLFYIKRVELGGKRAFHAGRWGGHGGGASAFPTLTVGASSEFEVFAYWPPIVTLNVVDGDTGVELQNVKLAAKAGWVRTPVPSHPGIKGTYLPLSPNADGEGSVMVDRDFPGENLWVGSPGYAWALIRLGRNTPKKPIRVALQRGCTVRVRVNGANGLPVLTKSQKRRGVGPYVLIKSPAPGSAGKDVELRYLIPEAREQWVGDREYVFEGLRAGPLHASISTSISKSADVLASSKIEMPAGESHLVVLDCTHLSRVGAPAPLKGTLRIPPGWEGQEDRMMQGYRPQKKWSLEIIPDRIPTQKTVHVGRESLKHAEGTPGVFAWDAGKVLPGRYQVRCMGPGEDLLRIIELNVPDKGLTNVDIQVPKMATVRVTAVVGEGREPASLHSVGWQPVGVPGLKSVRRNSAIAEWLNDKLEFRAPVGDIQLTLSDPRYCQVSRLVHLVPGENHIEFELEYGCKVEFEILGEPPGNGATTSLTRTLTHSASFRCLSGDGQVQKFFGVRRPMRNSDEPMKWNVSLSQPGTYEFSMANIPGYEPIESVRFTVASGETAKAVIRFRSK